ncbi:MAG: SVM family protein [Lettuce witches'-broom phytoplasma]
MFQLKNQFKMIYLCLIAFLVLLFLFNNYSLMAMSNNENKQKKHTNCRKNCK